MSTPDTNTAKQARRHWGPLVGMALATIFGVLVIGYWITEEVATSDPVTRPAESSPAATAPPANDPAMTAPPGSTEPPLVTRPEGG